MPVVIPEFRNYAEADAVLRGRRYEGERIRSGGMRVTDDGTVRSAPESTATFVTVSGWTGLTRGGRRP